MKRLVWVALALLLQTSSFSFARAEQYTPTSMTAADVLAKADEASGTLEPGRYVEIEKDHAGGLDTVTTRHTSGDNYVETDTTGPFTTAFGAYQGQHWRQDANGVVVLVNRFRAKTDPNVLAWEHPADPASGIRVLGVTGESPQEYVLEANPRGGYDQFRYYNASTFLLDRIVSYPSDRHRHVVVFSDYRQVYGEKRWFQRTYRDGRPQNDETDRIVSFQAERAGTASLAIPSSHPLFQLGPQPVTLPARFTRDGIVVRVNVGTRGLDFLLDSGASDILLDPGVAHELGIQQYGKSTTTIGGDFDTSLARVNHMDVGPLGMSNVAISLGPIQDQLADARIVGLLGFDFLASGITCIDFKNRQITLFSRTTFIARTAGFVPEPMMVDDGVPRIPASFEKVPGWFLLDTGAFGTVLYNDYVRKLPSAHVTDSPIDGLSAVGGDVDVRAYATNDFIVGPVMFRNAVVYVPQQSTFDMLDYDGIIGRDALSVFDVCLDYADRQVFLRTDT